MSSKRDIDSLVEAELLTANVKPVIFARLDFAGGVQRFHTEIGPKTVTVPVHGQEVYTGLGDFGGISSSVVETITGAPQALRLSLTGVKASLITSLLTDDYYRRNGDVFIGLEDDNGEIIAEPESLFSGFMDKADIALKDGFGQITMTCEGRGTIWRTGSDQRFTDEDLQAAWPGDLLGEYVWRMQDISLKWGKGRFGGGFGTGLRDYDRIPPGGQRR